MISGIYPHLAYYNQEGECGTGAVVPWAGKLWVITYGPHLPAGSSDKLYEITPDYRQIVRQESIGGTPANRMIHRESNQLFIGPYAIDSAGGVRVIPYTSMYGRLTGTARHLTDPANQLYFGTMEEGFYEVDARTLQVKELYRDGNIKEQPDKGDYSGGPLNDLLPGVHGKGLYSGQGVLVYTNNGEGTQEALSRFDIEAGVLAEWNGRKWQVIRRNQFVEVTGPGGLSGNEHPESDPLWATGWDHKSVLVGVRDAERGWSFFRLPKASHSYDGAHGWNTEWPRIRNVGTADAPDYLMTMHGMFWRFPAAFSADNSGGIRPRSAYLKVIGDFARWDDRLVFGCDDAAQKEFLNNRRIKGGISGPGQSNSNLWFTSVGKPDELGPATATGSVWANERVRANVCSEPFLFAGWERRCCWIRNGGDCPVNFLFEIDRTGRGDWSSWRRVPVGAGESCYLDFPVDEKGEWIRVTSDGDAVATVCFAYTDADRRSTVPDRMFDGLARIGSDEAAGGWLYALGDDRRALGVLSADGYYELNGELVLERKNDSATAEYMRTHLKIPRESVVADSGSVLIVDDRGRRWRLPAGDARFRNPTAEGELRVCREVATERDLFSCFGTFYELPAENADGFAKIRPIATHPFRIADYASYRGLLVMTGVDLLRRDDRSHIQVSDDGKAAVWAGCIDDLWALGKPTGQGGPWVDAAVRAGDCSDPYLIGFYDRKQLTLRHDADRPVRFTVEADPTGNGDWMTYAVFSVAPGESTTHRFPDAFQARWVRFRTDSDTRATTWLVYE